MNTNCALTNEEESTILDMNLIIMSELKEKDELEDNWEEEKKEKENLESKQNFKNNDLNFSPEIESSTIFKVNSALVKAHKSRDFLKSLQEGIEKSDDKLKQILHNRDGLSNVLKEFNTKTKEISQEKEKLVKLNESIQKIYKKYEITKSIEAFFENTQDDCVEKFRFISDYEEIENGINFFTLNSNYVDAGSFLNTYNMLKRISLTRFTKYVVTSMSPLQKGLGIEYQDEFANFIFSYGPRNKFYKFPRNFVKFVDVQKFFEKRAKYDYEVKMSLGGVKNKFVDFRGSIIKSIFEEIINKNIPIETNLINILQEISIFTLCEIVYFLTIFQTIANENTSILQSLIGRIYDSLYGILRPLIINEDNLGFLLSIFDAFSQYFGIFFLDVTNENQIEVEEKLILFFHDQIVSQENHVQRIVKENYETFSSILTLAKYLIRPTILKLVQDVQEKIYFKIQSHVKNAFLDIEWDLQAISSQEEKMAGTNILFKYFHFFLGRMAVIFSILKNKLDKAILDELTILAIEKFVTILNEEILKEKILSFNFELYIIQQILLVIKILDDFDIEAVAVETEVDFYSLTDFFTKDYLNLVNWAPKIYDKTRDFKKILYNNLLKAYKMLINLVTDFLLGREIMDFVYKIRNKEKVDKTLIHLRVKKEPFYYLYEKFEKVVNEMKNKLEIIDSKICEKLINTVLENLEKITSNIRQELIKNECKDEDYEFILNIIGLEEDNIMKNLRNIKLSIMS